MGATEDLQDAREKFPIGSQWLTSGGWRAVVVDYYLDGIWCWHGNPNTSRPHRFDGKGCSETGKYDLLTPYPLAVNEQLTKPPENVSCAEMTIANDMKAALSWADRELEAYEQYVDSHREAINQRDADLVCGYIKVLKTIRSVLTTQDANAELLAALKYAHSQMQPFCDDTIVKQAIAAAEQKAGR